MMLTVVLTALCLVGSHAADVVQIADVPPVPLDVEPVFPDDVVAGAVELEAAADSNVELLGPNSVIGCFQITSGWPVQSGIYVGSYPALQKRYHLYGRTQHALIGIGTIWYLGHLNDAGGIVPLASNDTGSTITATTPPPASLSGTYSATVAAVACPVDEDASGNAPFVMASSVPSGADDVTFSGVFRNDPGSDFVWNATQVVALAKDSQGALQHVDEATGSSQVRRDRHEPGSSFNYWSVISGGQELGTLLIDETGYSEVHKPYFPVGAGANIYNRRRDPGTAPTVGLPDYPGVRSVDIFPLGNGASGPFFINIPTIIQMTGAFLGSAAGQYYPAQPPIFSNGALVYVHQSSSWFLKRFFFLGAYRFCITNAANGVLLCTSNTGFAGLYHGHPSQLTQDGATLFTPSYGYAMGNVATAGPPPTSTAAPSTTAAPITTSTAAPAATTTTAAPVATTTTAAPVATTTTAAPVATTTTAAPATTTIAATAATTSTAAPAITTTAAPATTSTAAPATTSTAAPATTSTAAPATTSTAAPATTSTAAPAITTTAAPATTSTAAPATTSTAAPATTSTAAPATTSTAGAVASTTAAPPTSSPTTTAGPCDGSAGLKVEGGSAVVCGHGLDLRASLTTMSEVACPEDPQGIDLGVAPLCVGPNNVVDMIHFAVTGSPLNTTSTCASNPGALNLESHMKICWDDGYELYDAAVQAVGP